PGENSSTGPITGVLWPNSCPRGLAMPATPLPSRVHLLPTPISSRVEASRRTRGAGCRSCLHLGRGSGAGHRPLHGGLRIADKTTLQAARQGIGQPNQPGTGTREGPQIVPDGVVGLPFHAEAFFALLDVLGQGPVGEAEAANRLRFLQD